MCLSEEGKIIDQFNNEKLSPMLAAIWETAREERRTNGFEHTFEGAFQEAFECGFKEGFKKGFEQGFKQGKLKEQRLIAKRLLQRQTPVELIIQATKMTAVELKQLEQEL